MRFVWLSAVLAAGMLFGQAPVKKAAPRKKTAAKAEEPRPQVSKGPFPLKSIRVEGLKILRPEQVIAASGLPVGAPAKAEDMDAAMQKLLTCGYFDRVAYRYEPVGEGYALTWEVQEVSVFYPAKFFDLPVPETQARQILSEADPLFGAKIPATQDVLQRYAQALNTKLGLKVEGEELRAKVESSDKGELFVEFRADKPLPTVYKVDFRGNRLLPAEELRPPASASAVGLVYDEKTFREVLDKRVRPLYEARGRLRVAFPKIETKPSPGLNAVDVLVTVDEGEEYKLRSVRVEGVGASADEMVREGEFQLDLTANMSAVAEGGRKIEKAVRRNGFLDAKISEERKIDDEKKVVDVTFAVEPGDRYSFDRVEIKGLDIITEPAIRKLWTMKTGSPFNPEYPDAFLDKIRNDGVLDNLGDTRSRYDINEANRSVVVTLTFKGAPPPDPKKRPGPPN
jgi:outer membrane protein assembly factor BamA